MIQGIRIAAITVVSGGLSACGTFGTGPQQGIFINTGEVAATCTVRSPATGRITVRAPGQALVRRSRSPLSISCDADGHAPASVVLRAKFDALAAGHRYPDRVRIVLRKVEPEPEPDSSVPKQRRTKLRDTS